MADPVRLRYTFTGTFDARWEDYTDPGPEGILDPHPARLARIIQESIEDGTVVQFFERLPKDGQSEVLIAPADQPDAARQFRDDIHRALQSGRWRGWGGADGVSKDEVIADVAAALERYDQATGRPDPAAGHAEPEGPL